MKRNFTNENFEDFLRHSADGLRMRPSGEVWKNVSKHLGRRRRRVGLALGSFVLAIATLGYFAIQNSTHKLNTFVETNPRNNLAKANNPLEKSITEQTHSAGQAGAAQHLKTRSIRLAQPSKITPSLHSPLSENKKPDIPNRYLTEEHPAFSFTIVDSYFEQPAEENNDKQAPAPNNAVAYPQTIESVMNTYLMGKKKKKLGFQFYFTPTISYRKLTENKSFLRSQPPGNSSYLPALIFDVNSVVTHKPNIGFEMGTTAKYPLTRNMKLRGGLQFNVNRYDIKAYNALTSVTTIMFNGRTNSSGADSLTTYTYYSNMNGYKTNWLQNYYIQISAPVGLEFKIGGDEKVQFGVATTIQPTYVLGDRAYLISTEYKRYAEVPQLVRRWNVNTALETFVGYSTGHLNWQVGPQVRYQLLSSFINKYPVKENLFDFGLKVGVSINK